MPVAAYGRPIVSAKFVEYNASLIPPMSIALPQVTIQHDFQTVIAEVQEGIIAEEPFWISCYKQENVSMHGKVKVQKAENGHVDLVSEQGMEFKKGEHVRLMNYHSLSGQV